MTMNDNMLDEHPSTNGSIRQCDLFHKKNTNYLVDERSRVQRSILITVLFLYLSFLKAKYFRMINIIEMISQRND
jgi:hypothetical protein